MKLYINNVFIQFRLPNIIISDRGPQFVSKVFNGISETIGVKHKLSTAFRPQTDNSQNAIIRNLKLICESIVPINQMNEVTSYL